MNTSLAILFVVLLLIVIFITVRIWQRKKLQEWNPNSFLISQDWTESSEVELCNDLKVYIEQTFSGKFIDNLKDKQIEDYLCEDYEKAYRLYKMSKLLFLHREDLDCFIEDYQNLSYLIAQHNKKYLSIQLEENSQFFDTVLAYPLDRQQRRAIVSEEMNCLVVSCAGSGKTSSIVGKVKYLIEVKHVNPKRILLISYTNKAASELTERVGVPGVQGFTFHKLAIDIIGQVTHKKPSICENTDVVFVGIFHDLLKDKVFKEKLLEYFVDYPIEQTTQEKAFDQERQKLSQEKSSKYKSLFPDMDGNTVYVRSEQERKLCFVLTSLGLNYRYEESYEYPLMDEVHSQYRPDFSIYYGSNGLTKRAYLENFGVDEHGCVPLWFAKDKNVSYDEANKTYGDGITWKREAHKKFHTLLLEISSADFHYYDIREKLKDLLSKNGIPYKDVPEELLYDKILPEGSKQERAFIRLAVTFITLMKTNNKTINEIEESIDGRMKKRNRFIVSEIMSPIYNRYKKRLAENQQSDFSDLILEATNLFSQTHPYSWDYIIVDEFQDISVDRYKFLQVLREGRAQAKLFCVGDDWQSIYRFSGSDLALFNQFEKYFGKTEINKIETTFRFGNPLVDLSSQFIQRNPVQIKKNVKPYSSDVTTTLVFQPYDKYHYENIMIQTLANIPKDKSVFFLGRYSFDDYYLSHVFKSVKQGNNFYYLIDGRKVEFLTVHKSKGLEADYVILLQCNQGIFGFPSEMNDDPVLNTILSKGDEFAYGEERRLFYVAITRAKLKTIVFYDQQYPSPFVMEFLHPELSQENSSKKLLHKNANKRWGRNGDRYLLDLYRKGNSIKQISKLMGRSQTAIIMRLQKLGEI